METPSSTTRFTNTIPLSRKFEDSEKTMSKSKPQQQQDRCALMDMTNDSPIVGLANGGNLDTPSAKPKASRVKNTPGSGEALLRGQAKTLMQMVQEEALDDGLPSINSSVVHQQQSLSQVVNMEEDEKYEIAKSLDFSEKSQVSEECNSEVSYQEITTQGSCVGSCSVDDDASIWSMQVNESINDEDDVEDEIAEEDDNEDDEDEEDYYDAGEEEYECGFGLDELCEGLNKVNVNEKAVPKFAGKHTRFVYDSDDEIVKEEEDESVDESNVLRLKGLPTPKGKHLRFSEEEEEGKI
ncbi:histone H2A.Z-specific chaperone CHZ1-like [Vicia villosa]|uniref:histone H2A.Z-specific chaperone CHZ1-like n=1 Tax=Vicia villosa TaxID=3911 RepID=UPI00273B6791|nr:histone H2A.Z-specific chaperone CHZ1-like [Vicia villosa]